MMLIMAACGETGGVEDEGVRPPDPSTRTVLLTTTGCGAASSRTGVGVAMGGDIVLTVAHTVARADTIEATLQGSIPQNVEIVAIDLPRDLAALRVSGMDVSDVSTARADVDTTGRLVTPRVPAGVPFVVRTHALLKTEEILGRQLHSRVGYELDTEAGLGDSGAGAWDEDGHLIGILFATEEDGATAWITAASEIEAFLAESDTDAAPLVCDPEASRIRAG